MLQSYSGSPHFKRKSTPFNYSVQSYASFSYFLQDIQNCECVFVFPSMKFKLFVDNTAKVCRDIWREKKKQHYMPFCFGGFVCEHVIVLLFIDEKQINILTEIKENEKSIIQVLFVVFSPPFFVVVGINTFHVNKVLAIKFGLI